MIKKQITEIAHCMAQGKLHKHRHLADDVTFPMFL